MTENACKACDGTGMLADDEGWKYNCSVCHGTGEFDQKSDSRTVKIMSVDSNNRLLD